jgi:tetratricopeptide (TPR) repeat protein
MQNPLNYLFWLVVLGGVLYYFLTVSYVTNQTKEEMRQAYVEYASGETAKTIGERKTAFNKSLELYTAIEKQFSPVNSDGRLYYNIANNYFQLGEYPYAVLYYNRSLKLAPRDDKAKHNLNITLEKLGIKPAKEGSAFNKIFFFHTNFSLPERRQIFFFLSLITIFFASTYVWQEKQWMKQLSSLMGILAALILLSLGYSHYIAPIEGIIVRSTILYRDAGVQYAKVVEDPVLSGKEVEVLDVLKDGKWLKIMTPEGNMGYVPHEAIIII